MSIRSLIVKVGANTQAIDQALEKLGSNVRKTDTDLKKLGNTPLAQAAQKSFEDMSRAMDSITKAQERVAERGRLAAAGIEQIGGASRLTKSELDQVNRSLQASLDAYRALGQDAPKQLQRVADAVAKQSKALSGGTTQTGLFSQAQGLLTSKLAAVAGPAALGAAVVAAFDYADSLSKLSDRTGIGIVALQRLGAVAEASGNTLDEVANAVNQFQKRLATGEAEQALQGLGLSIADIRALSPDEQFFALAKAVGQIPDPAQQAATAMELFGKSGGQLLPTLKSDIDSLKNSTVTMSAETVKTLDDAGDAFGRLKTNALNVLGEIAAGAISLVGAIGQIPGALADAARGQGAPAPNQVAVPDMLVGDAIPENIRRGLTPQQLAQLVRGEAAILPQSPGSAFNAPASALPVPSADDQKAIIALLEKQRLAFNEANKGAIEYERQLAAVNAKLRELTAPVTALTDEQKDLVTTYRDLGLSNQDIAIKLRTTTTSVTAYTDELDSHFTQIERNREATGRFQQELGKMVVGFDRAGKASIGFRGVVEAKPLLEAAQSTDAFGAGLLKISDVGPKAATGVQRYRAEADQARARSEEFGRTLNGLADAFAKIAQVSGGAFGGIVQEIGNIITSLNLAKKAADDFAASESKAGKAAALIAGAAAVGQATGSGSTIGRTVGGAATGAQLGGAVGGPIGAGIGAVAGGVIGFIRGIGSAEKQVNPLREAFVQAAGGLGELNRKAFEATGSLDLVRRLLDAKNPKQYQAAVDDLNRAFEKQQQRAAAVDGAVSGLTAAVDAAGGRMPKALRETVRQLAEMQGLSEANRAAISALADAAEPNFADLQRRASDFGITLGQLGPTFQQADIDSRAKNITDLFTDLTEAGGNANGILTGMSDEIGQLITDTQAFGGAIPEAMRPLLQSFIDAGQLTDAAGNKITDLSGINFKETPLDKGTTAIVDAIKELKDVIAGLPGVARQSAKGVGDVFSNLNPSITVDIGYRYDPPDFEQPFGAAATGGRVTPTGIQRFGGGGRVLPFRPVGTDTVPAMLTPGEIILNAAQQGRVSQAIAASPVVGLTAVINVNGYVDSPAAQRNLGRIVNNEIGRVVRRTRKGRAA